MRKVARGDLIRQTIDGFTQEGCQATPWMTEHRVDFVGRKEMDRFDP
jgi:hypothetical protein